MFYQLFTEHKNIKDRFSYKDKSGLLLYYKNYKLSKALYLVHFLLL